MNKKSQSTLLVSIVINYMSELYINDYNKIGKNFGKITIILRMIIYGIIKFMQEF